MRFMFTLYRNYVVQFVIQMQISNAAIVQRLAGNFVKLSRNKFGNYVVQMLLENSNLRIVGFIIQEIMNSPEFLDVLLSPFGNHVAQAGLKFSVVSIYIIT